MCIAAPEPRSRSTPSYGARLATVKRHAPRFCCHNVESSRPAQTVSAGLLLDVGGSLKRKSADPEPLRRLCRSVVVRLAASYERAPSAASETIWMRSARV
jgi:hypothetical protein